VRCIPLAQPGGEGVCFYTGKPATEMAIFAKSY
jgi:prolyl-tRNA synthetase